MKGIDIMDEEQKTETQNKIEEMLKKSEEIVQAGMRPCLVDLIKKKYRRIEHEIN